ESDPNIMSDNILAEKLINKEIDLFFMKAFDGVINNHKYFLENVKYVVMDQKAMSWSKDLKYVFNLLPWGDIGYGDRGIALYEQHNNLKSVLLKAGGDSAMLTGQSLFSFFVPNKIRTEQSDYNIFDFISSDELAEIEEALPNFNVKEAALTKWKELVRDPKSQDSVIKSEEGFSLEYAKYSTEVYTKKNQENYFENQKQVRIAFLRLLKRIKTEDLLSLKEFDKELVYLHKILLTGVDGETFYIPRTLPMFWKDKYFVLFGGEGSLRDEFLSYVESLSLKTTHDMRINIYKVFKHFVFLSDKKGFLGKETVDWISSLFYKISTSSEGDYFIIFKHGNYSLFMNMFNTMLNLSGLNGIAHKNLDFKTNDYNLSEAKFKTIFLKEVIKANKDKKELFPEKDNAMLVEKPSLLSFQTLLEGTQLWEEFKKLNREINAKLSWDKDPKVVELAGTREQIIEKFYEQTDVIHLDEIVFLSLEIDRGEGVFHHIAIVDKLENIIAGNIKIGSAYVKVKKFEEYILGGNISKGDFIFSISVEEHKRLQSIYFRLVSLGNDTNGTKDRLRGKKYMEPIFKRLTVQFWEKYDDWKFKIEPVRRETKIFTEALMDVNYTFSGFEANGKIRKPVLEESVLVDQAMMADEAKLFKIVDNKFIEDLEEDEITINQIFFRTIMGRIFKKYFPNFELEVKVYAFPQDNKNVDILKGLNASKKWIKSYTEKRIAKEQYKSYMLAFKAKREDPVMEDKAMLTDKEVGGINLNPDKIDLQIRGEGQEFDIDTGDLENIEINGLIPVIFSITPVVNLPLLLGAVEDDSPNEVQTLELSKAIKS
ncbi:MAG: hypothetical protein P9X22_01825, partial [Candidatus Zapsychrus exili]|nr:hypothetical protein [Candidatus Zapsychrus exili]